MRDAIHLALDHMKKLRQDSDKKVLLVITDGNDNTSDETLEQLVREARQSGVLIYCIGLLNEEDPRDKRDAPSARSRLWRRPRAAWITIPRIWRKWRRSRRRSPRRSAIST